MAYEYFFKFYDYLMNDVKYDEYVDLIKKYADKDSLLLDVACGTGNVLVKLLKNGYNVSGLDISDEMLLICQEKLQDNNLFTNLYQDDMRNIQILDYYDLIYSFLDSINYLISIEDINMTFRNIYLALKDNGYFIFDVHSVENVNLVFDGYSFNEVKDDYAFLWNSYVDKSNDYSIVYHELNFFNKSINNLYQKFSEYHKQVIFPVNVYKDLLEKNNFMIEKIFENESHKIIFVAKKCST